MISKIIDFLRTYRFKRSIRLLIRKGMKIGKNVHIMPGVFFDEAYAFLINIGDNCTITSGVRILAHDASIYRDLGFAKIGKVEIKHNTFIGNSTIILPGVTIGPNAIIGAGSVITTDVPENSVVAGNPAKIISKKEDFLKRHKENYKTSQVFEYNTFFYNEKSYLQETDFKKAYLTGGEKEANLKWLERK